MRKFITLTLAVLCLALQPLSAQNTEGTDNYKFHKAMEIIENGGDLAEARKLVSENIEANPNHIDSYLLIARIDREEDDYASALRAIELATKNNHKKSGFSEAFLLWWKGVIYGDIGDFQKAVDTMKQAVKLRMIAYNPCEGVTLPKRKKYKSNVYDTEMISKLLDLARGTDIYIPILLCVSAGLRRGEMLALGWDNVDFEKGIISIQRNLVRGEDGYIIKAPKSESGIRDIHLGREVMEELRKAKVQHFSQMMESGIAFNQKYNFVVRQDDGSPFTPDAMTRKWKRFITRHKLPNIRLHDLRHSHATALIKAGVNPRVVQERLGHADVSITLNTYTHVLPEMDIDAAEKIDNMILRKA